MTDIECPAGNSNQVFLTLDSIPDIQHYHIDSDVVSQKAYYIWKRYGNADAV